MEMIQILKFASAFVFVISLMLGLGWAAKRFGLPGAVQARAGKRRLQIIEALPLDGRRRLLLVRRDDQEHLIVVGPQGETVVENNIEAAEMVDLKVVKSKTA